MAECRRQKYRCNQCNKEDHLKLWPNEIAPQALNCMFCGAGRGMQIADQLMQRIGIFPVIEQTEGGENANQISM